MSKHEPAQPKGLMDEDGRLASRLVLDDAEEASRMHWSMLVKMGPAMAVITAAVILAYAVPGLEWARPWKPGDPVPYWNVLGRPFESEAKQEQAERAEKVDDLAQQMLAEEPAPEITPEVEVVEPDPGDALPAYEPHPDDDKPVEQELELFEGHELDPFFAKLARTDASLAGATTRVVHWGDSAIGVDGIPGAIRQRMQARFGDAGHGFHVMAPPNTSYRHKGVKFEHNDSWRRCFIIRKCRSDGRYGLGGTSTESSGGAESAFEPDPKHSSGHVSKFDLYYLAQPRGGNIRLRVDGGEPTMIDTDAPTIEDRWHAIEVEDGPHELEVRAAGGGKVRVYGVTLERQVPGVVWDTLALVGSFTNRLLEFDPEHLKAQLNHREADLAVFTFGGNDMIRRIKASTYEQEYRDVIRLVKTARPEISCLVMAPLDHGMRDGNRIVSLPVVPRIVAAQRNAAKAEGCAFFDTYQAMGGKGSAGRWYRQSPRLIGGDLGHATHKGHIVIGEMFYRALLHAYVAYRKREG